MDMRFASMFLFAAALSFIAWGFYVRSHEMTLPAAGSTENPASEQDMPAVYKKQQALFITAGACVGICCFLALADMVGAKNSPTSIAALITKPHAWAPLLGCVAVTLLAFAWFHHAQGQTEAHSESYNVKTTATLEAVAGSIAAVAAVLFGTQGVPISQA